MIDGQAFDIESVQAIPQCSALLRHGMPEFSTFRYMQDSRRWKRPWPDHRIPDPA